eukprot:3525339-Prymnesium_polylepis.1
MSSASRGLEIEFSTEGAVWRLCRMCGRVRPSDWSADTRAGHRCERSKAVMLLCPAAPRASR